MSLSCSLPLCDLDDTPVYDERFLNKYARITLELFSREQTSFVKWLVKCILTNPQQKAILQFVDVRKDVGWFTARYSFNINYNDDKRCKQLRTTAASFSLMLLVLSVTECQDGYFGTLLRPHMSLSLWQLWQDDRTLSERMCYWLDGWHLSDR